jgi:hypothetical protein
MNQNPSARKRERFLPYALPSIGEEEIAEVADSMRSGWLTTGPKTKKTKRFEGDLQAYIGAKQAIAVNSCTAGLHIALTALGIGPGDEVDRADTHILLNRKCGRTSWRKAGSRECRGGLQCYAASDRICNHFPNKSYCARSLCRAGM